MSTLTIERKKSKRAWILLAVAALLIGLNILNGVGNYLSNEKILEVQGVNWGAVWGQAGLLWSVLFFPFLITVRAGALTRMEHEQANWRRMRSYGALISIYKGKLILLTGFVLTCQVLFAAGVIVSSFALGFTLTLADLSAIVCWTLLGVVGGMTIASIQLLVGILVHSFASTVAIGLIASIGSLMVTLVAPAFAVIYPYAQISIGMRIRALSWPGAPELFGYIVVNVVFILVAVFLGSLVLRRKED